MRILKLFTLAVTALLVTSCATLQEYAELQKPTAKIQDVKITGISFQDVTLQFDMAVSNPNPIGLNSSGLDYALSLEGSEFISVNDPNRNIAISSLGSSMVSLPITLNYEGAYKLISGLRNKESLNYGLAAGLFFDLPVIGQIRVPVSYEGVVPVPKLPEIKLSSIKLDSLSLTKAKIDIGMNILNPNSFSLNALNLDYQVDIAGAGLINGTMEQSEVLSGKSTNLTLPIELSFLESGMALYRVLKSGSSEVTVKGNLKADTELELLESVDKAFQFTSNLTR